MKHAFCIIAHNSPLLLKYLLKSIDHPNCDVYIHVDKKCCINDYRISLKYSKVYYLEDRYDVTWGSYSLISAELSLFECAHKKKYDYYHLLSGVDALIKPIDYILSFFEKNKGYEFLGAHKADKLHYYRVSCYHFYVKRTRISYIVSNLENLIQRFLGISRFNKDEVYYGNEWGSFTNLFIDKILSKRVWIEKHFKYTQCGDEIYKQTLMYKMGFDINDKGSIRLIDWERGNPYTFKKDDFDLIVSSTKLLARKFSEKDIDIVDALYKKIHLDSKIH